jgi:alkyl sulfatase BDS1-like metallo-beta-lactamase superfamily hydrolase
VDLHVRRGVAEYMPDFANYYRQPDLTVSLDGKTFAELYLNATDLATALGSNGAKVTQGDPAEAAALLDLFDKFEPVNNVMVPAGAYR